MQSRLMSLYQSGSWMKVKVVRWCFKRWNQHWCISITNNVWNNAKKHNKKAQTPNFNVCAIEHRPHQQVFPENCCFLWKLKRFFGQNHYFGPLWPNDHPQVITRGWKALSLEGYHISDGKRKKKNSFILWSVRFLVTPPGRLFTWPETVSYFFWKCDDQFRK